MNDVYIQRFILGELKTNGYVITDDHSFCVIIDPGEDPHEIIQMIRKRKVDYILLTHSHHDHIAGLNSIKEYTDAPVVVHHLEADWLLDPQLNQSSKRSKPIISQWPDILLNGDEIIQCGSTFIKAIHTPGHSPGSTCYLFNHQILFSGDTLLAGIVGPTQLPFGDRELLKKSIREKLFQLPGDITVYPGHGKNTTILYEKEHNIFPNIKYFY